MSIFDGIPDRDPNPPENRRAEDYVNSKQFTYDLADAVDEWKANPKNAKRLDDIVWDLLPEFDVLDILNSEDFQSDLNEQVDAKIAEKVAGLVQYQYLHPEEYF